LLPTTADKWNKIATSIYNHPDTIYENKLYIFDNTNANPKAYDLVTKPGPKVCLLQGQLEMEPA